MAKLPPVKLETHATWFNLLLTLLHEHAESNPYEEYRRMAQRLFSKCMAYGTPFTDGYERPAWICGCTPAKPEKLSGCFCLPFAGSMTRIEITARS